MSKKIIYLLSLLMVLSLLFAGCKKDNPFNSVNNNQKENTEFSPTDTTHGFLTKEELEDYASEYIEDKVVLSGNANEFSRNPVIAVMGSARDTVLIVAERRYDSPGSENDMGLDGVNKTDLYFVVGTKSGTEMGTPAVIGAPATDAATSHAAPVLFKINEKNVIIVASTGAGLSRTDQDYSSRTVKSGLQYIGGQLNGSTMEWGTWKDIKIMEYEVDEYISNTEEVKNLGKPQFGTHSARGYVIPDGYTGERMLVIPIVLADQGTIDSPKEKMAILFLVAGVANSGKDAIPYWTPVDINKIMTFTESGNYSQYKESIIIGGESIQYDYLIIPNPNYSGKTMKLGIGAGTGAITEGYMKAGEGSAGYLKLSEGWYGTETYDPQNYNPADKSQGIVLLSHVTSDETDMKLYVYDPNVKLSAAPKHTLTITNKGKSSSIDILGDGTIVTVAEEGLRAGSTKKNDFVIRFSRYTQNYISTVKTKK